MNKVRVVMLVSDGDSSRIIYHKIKKYCNLVCVIKENPIPRSVLLKNRIKKLGLTKVIGQLIFIMFNKFLKLLSKNRIKEIKNQYNLNTNSIVHEYVVSVNSINDKEVAKLLKKINPDMVLVNGTRIINENILLSLNKPFVNTHAGITPRYRGVHGGYWALVNNDRNNCGVTVHLVDKGIDTGNVLYQTLIEISKKDNFNTYPYLQIAKAVRLLKNVIEDVDKSSLIVKKSIVDDSQLWSHPSIIEYMKNYFQHSIK